MIGKVLSNKMSKALVVSVDAVKVHPMYKKRYKTAKKYSVACSDSSLFAVGSKVTIRECPPVSKTIKFQVVEQ
jgi:small subunit ribosomal protein S17